ncbi:hypothetical protein SAMD00023353_7200240 [Rosellinia necatrix]|uniref:Uncharacterized protein n=1 Tax=Rosellinia necatrix TaxID=77044 RepID=A0A1S8AAP5_ROSNE|nr:hypothetical protein SAMD00023353_7200240 [Rosellinia necatrix]
MKAIFEIRAGIEKFQQLLEGHRVYPPILSVFTRADLSLKTPALYGLREIEWKFLSRLGFEMMHNKLTTQATGNTLAGHLYCTG